MVTRIIALVIGLWAGVAWGAGAGLRVGGLRCEYRVDPIGVDVGRPRLSWVLSSDRNGEGQTAYEVVVGSSEGKVRAGEGDVWDSGKVASGESVLVEYGGKGLESRKGYWWAVKVWDREGVASGWSEVGTFGMGVMDGWKGKWIGEGLVVAKATTPRRTTAPSTAEATSRPVTALPLPIFRREFEVAKPVKRAVAYFCGLGQFELRVNGEKVGDEVLEPGWTNFRKSCLYTSHDVTKQLVVGRNAVGVMVGNGMYHMERWPGRFAKFVGSFGEPCVTGEIFIEYEDGSSASVVTDGSWEAARGPIVFSSTYGGEDYDARLEQAGWDRAGFEEKGWGKAEEVEGPGGELVGVRGSARAVRVERALRAVAVTEPRAGVKVFDLGQNCAVMPVVTVRGERGARVRITPGELLNKEGVVEQQWARRGECYFEYTLKGEGEETWGPRFTYYGCRYLMVEEVKGDASGGRTSAFGDRPSPQPSPGVPGEGAARPFGPPLNGVEVVDCVGRFITGAESAGTFACSNELFDRTSQLIDWAIWSNTVSIFTDCPHREKLGWLEQTHLMGPSLAYTDEVAVGLGKMCRDMREAQLGNGLVPNIAPEYTVFKGSFRDSPEWGSAAVMVPWQVYEWYGDERVLRESWGMMKGYVAYLGSTAKDGGIVSHGLGDWYDLGPKGPGVAQLTPVGVTATGFYYGDLRVMERAAKVVGTSAEAEEYGKLAEGVKEAFNREFYHRDVKSYATGSQCANAVPVVFGLVPEEDVDAVVGKIVADVKKNGLTAGDVGYRFLLRALADHGRSDVVFEMNDQSERPGYGYMLKHGATALTEAWNARSGASQDHFMLGHIQEWFYGDLVGIKQEAGSVGWGRVSIRPCVVGDVTWARAVYRSVRGEIGCEWKREGEKVRVEVGLPPGVSGVVWVPGEKEGRSVGSGRYSFEGRVEK